MLPRDQQVDASFYDRAYYRDGTKSAYAPYGPGSWAQDLARMIKEYLAPASVLDVGCAHGYLLERLIDDFEIPACGFDISQYAVDNRVVSNIWQGDVGDPEAYRVEVDLIVASEVPEHLVPDQARRFLENAANHGQRLLLLGIVGDDHGEDQSDHSHINIKPIEWWIAEARVFGWVIEDASQLNDDDRSKSMGWADRFLLFRLDRG